jgi:hypothetical protein
LDRFALDNPAWITCLEQVVTQVQIGLGLEKQALATHLYELLLYEKGSFFTTSRW